MLMALTLLAAAPVAPSPAAIALGERLARTGTLGSLLPLQAEKEADELAAQHPELSPVEQARLRSIATLTAARMATRLFAIEGRRYAELLSEADLRRLVADADSPAAGRLRAAMPQVIAAAMAGMAGVDFKKEVTAAFCAETGKACLTR